jgi:DNA-binding MarR family transcriptional regulator
VTQERDEESLADAFWAVARRLRHGSQQTLAPFELAPSQSRALRVLMRHGSMRLNALSEHLGIAARSTTEVVDALEERGLVTRRPDPSDRRATLVEASDRGRALMTQVRAARRDEADQVFAGLTPADRAELLRILGTLRD